MGRAREIVDRAAMPGEHRRERRVALGSQSLSEGTNFEGRSREAVQTEGGALPGSTCVEGRLVTVARTDAPRPPGQPGPARKRTGGLRRKRKRHVGEKVMPERAA